MEFHYDQQQTLHWLAWLAEQMQKRNQTEWYLERSQPSWLPDEQTQHRFRHAAIRVIYGIKCFLVAGLFALLPGGVFTTFLETGQRAVLRAGSSNEALGWIAPGIAGGSASLGIILALVTILVFLMVGPQVPTISLQAVKRGFIEAMRTGVITGGIIGFCAALVCIPATGIEGGLVRGADIGLLGGLLIGIQWGLLAALRKKSPLDSNEQERHLRSFSFSLFRSRRLLDRLLDFLVFSSCAGVGYGGIYALLIKGITPDVIRYSTITALFFGIVLSWGNITEWVQGIGDAIQPAETATWSWTAVRRTLRSTLKRGGIIGLIVTICVIILLGTASGLFYGVNYGIRFGFVCGPIIGLTGATAALLTGVLNSGWKTAMLPDHQIVQPNEGIRRSLKNAVFAGCLFGPLGGLASGLISGLAFGYIGGFSRWPVQSIICALVFSMIFAFQFALVYGGIAWLQHYLLRWYLWKSGNLPANWRRFFDYASERILLIKVGGGYMFAHKLLLDYFASLRAVETDQRGETNPPGSSPRSIGQSTSDTR